jgi:hypothetical protein
MIKKRAEEAANKSGASGESNPAKEKSGK